jgi:hypothetical protein
MAQTIRSAKSGSEWTRNELRAYNIQVVADNVATFFGNPDLPRLSVRQAILVNEDYPIDGLPDKDDRLFFDLMKCAMSTVFAEESAVDDFAAHLFRMLGYDEPDRFIRQRKDIPLFMCGSRVHAKTDVCIISRNLEFILLVQEDKRYQEDTNPEMQLIAEAIAAFQYNNLRLSRIGLPVLHQKTIPGITMIGTTPTFYKIGVTIALIQAVETAAYPSEATIVHKLVPPVPQPDLLVHGMRPLENRAFLFGSFEAFKQFL